MNTDTHTHKNPCDRWRQRLDWYTCTPRKTQDGWPPPQARKRQGGILFSLRGAWLCRHLDFRRLSLQNCEIINFRCKLRSLWYYVTDAPANEYTYFLLQTAWKWSESEKWSCSVMSDSLQPRGLYPTRLLHPWDSPGKNTGVGYHFLLQGTFPTQGSNPGLPHWRQTLYPLSHQGSPTNGIIIIKKNEYC